MLSLLVKHTTPANQSGNSHGKQLRFQEKVKFQKALPENGKVFKIDVIYLSAGKNIQSLIIMLLICSPERHTWVSKIATRVNHDSQREYMDEITMLYISNVYQE